MLDLDEDVNFSSGRECNMLGLDEDVKPLNEKDCNTLISLTLKAGKIQINL